MGVVKKAFKAIGLTQEAPRLETKIPAQQLERQQEVGAEDIEVGGGDSTSTSSAKGKRGLVRPVASSLGV